MTLEEELQAHEAEIETLLKSVKRYTTTLNAWKKAAKVGNVNAIQRTSTLAYELANGLPAATGAAASSWTFNSRGYLASGEWRKELQATAASRFDLRITEDNETLVSSPVMIRAQPARGALMIGKRSWSSLRPAVTAAELKRLRDRLSQGNSQEFVDSLLGACEYLDKENRFGRFRDIYNLFCLTPGYKRENSRAAFAQQIYSLQKSGIQFARGTYRFEFEYPSGNAKPDDVFTVISESGNPISYYAIWFK